MTVKLVGLGVVARSKLIPRLIGTHSESPVCRKAGLLNGTQVPHAILSTVMHYFYFHLGLFIIIAY